MNIELFLATLGTLFGAFSIFLILKQNRKLKKFFAGKNAGDLEYVLEDIIKALKTEIQKREHSDTRIKELEEESEKSLRGLGIVRYNPFPDVGGMQSFCVALLNEKRDGFVISSLYARDRMSLFCKPINNLSSEFELSTEEKQALDKALKNI